MREDDGTRVARKLPGRRAVPDSFEGTIFINEIVLTIYGEVKLSLHLLHHISVQWVRAGGGAPKAEGIILNRRELGCAKKARDVEHLSNGTNRASEINPPSVACQNIVWWNSLKSTVGVASIVLHAEAD